MIYFNDVTKKYNKSDASLKDVSFSVSRGEFVSIIGHSGAGKTTIIKLILAEEKPTEGTVFFESKNINKLSSRGLTKLRRKIGTIFQDFRLLRDKTVYENIAFTMEATGRKDEEIMQDVPHILELVDLTNKAFHYPNQLSGGEKQRLGIARAIINQPEIILADEPTGNLDPLNSTEVINILKKINELGTTVILATHDKNIVDQVKKRVITLENGCIVRDDKEGKYMI